MRSPRPAERSFAGFHFTQRMGALCEDIVARCPDLAHIQMQQVGVTWTQARKRTVHGLHAWLLPMRFQGGALDGRIGRRRYCVQRMYGPLGHEYLYLLAFCLPRFLDLGFGDKLTTVFHELWHISPTFDGDLRRHSGRCYAHTRSQHAYDQQMKQQARQWLDAHPPKELYDFLYLDFATLYRTQGPIGGVKLRRPRLIPID